MRNRFLPCSGFAPRIGCDVRAPAGLMFACCRSRAPYRALARAAETVHTDPLVIAMQRRPIADTGLEIAPIGLGTWAMGGAAESWGPVDDNESIAAIAQALDEGVNLIDTAPVYGLGHSEEIVGKAMIGRRQEVVLATKCGVMLPDGETQQSTRCLKPDSIIDECEASLRRLKIDTIDLYQCHWPDPDTPITDTMDSLQKLLKQGKIRAIGISNFSLEQLAEARQAGPVHCVQPPFSALQTRASEELIPYCREHNIAVIAYSPLAKGLLTGKFDLKTELNPIRQRDPEFLGQRYEQNLRLVDKLAGIAEKYGKTIPQLAINWVSEYPGVTAAIVGAKRPSQVLENLGGSGWTLSEEDRNLIESLRSEA